jgi:glycerate dehydrogenase
MKAVFLDFDTVSHGDIDAGPLEATGIDLELYAVTRDQEIEQRIGPAEIVIVNKICLDAPRLGMASRLRLVCLAATGTNNVDIDDARARGVGVCNIESYCTQSVTQHVFAVMLALTHHLQSYQELLQAGAWTDSPQFCLLDFPIRELAGRTLGIVGLGELGSAVARVAEAFGMRILVAQRPGPGSAVEGRVPLARLLAESDVVSLHCPLTDATRGLIGADELAAMKPDALLINTARGALVDSAALAEALRAGDIGGAGIDVLPEEPPIHGDPLLAKDIPNLIVTPHIAWAARESRQRAVNEIAANIQSFLSGGRRQRIV